MVRSKNCVNIAPNVVDMEAVTTVTVIINVASCVPFRCCSCCFYCSEIVIPQLNDDRMHVWNEATISLGRQSIYIHNNDDKGSSSSAVAVHRILSACHLPACGSSTIL